MTTMQMMNPICLKLIQTVFLTCLVFQANFVCSKEVFRCLQSERQALLQFKAGLIDVYGMLSSWTTADCCQWKGIHCSNLTGHVLMLDLHGNYDINHDYYYDDTSKFYITGDIHKSLIELQQLQYLNLSGNNFKRSCIPSFFGSLRNLRYLDLSGNGLDGVIPRQLGNLSYLQFLDLSNNHLEGSIPSQLGKLTNLQELYLGGFGALTIDNEDHRGGQWLSNLTSLTHLHMFYMSNLHKFNSWLKMVGKLPKLRELSLRDCGLSDHFILSLSNSKFKFSTSLSILDLTWNNFASSLIFEWVSNISPNIARLDLSYNRMVDLPSNHFSHRLPKLRELVLSNNQFISFMILQSLSNMSSNLVDLDLSYNLLEVPPSNGYGIMMKSLEILDLSYNGLTGGVFKSFTNVCTLRSLVLYDNKFTEELQSILQNLSNGCVRNSLQVLDLSYNEIIGTFPNLSIFASLKNLDLSYNKLSGKITEGGSLPFLLEQLSIASNSLEGEIPKSIWMNACKLKSLDLSDNRFTGELQVIIHHLSICARYSLKTLDLSINQINGTLPDLSIFLFLEMFDISKNRLNGEIFEDIRFPTTLTKLQMNSNSLSGVISDFHLTGMSMLRHLCLSHNSITLRFTENWVPPFQLRKIRLQSCKLGPTFPKWIQTQKHIQILDISNAGISDNVPEWFWVKLSSPECRSINISNNNLKGLIPNIQVKNLCSLLSLSSNEFEGTIPPFLQGSTLIDLSKNKFSNSLPFLCANSIDAMLGQFDLSNNQLSGRVPDCWSNFKSLVYLDLSHNNFSGKIPTSMGSLVNLQALLLRNNSLTEKIPSSLMNCTRLVMLDLGENRLEGLIPYWIGIELKKLQVLSLQRNHFFGSLPFELCYLQKIQFIDLSLNNLSGCIPKCIKNFTLMTQKPSSEDLIDLTNHVYLIKKRFGVDIVKYEMNAFLTWKGVEQMFKDNELFLLKSIDLSSNHFSGEIPHEITNLMQLVSLNLSRNNFVGKIPARLGKLTSLDFLDLSQNKLLGSIPPSLSQIDRLSVLDLSHNQLSGEISTSTQLQSFNTSSYEDNLDLCGPPLVKLCAQGEPPHEPKDEVQDDEDLLLNHGIYISLTFGFIIGFWGVFGSIIIKRTWRHAYFKFMNILADNIYVKCRRWLRG